MFVYIYIYIVNAFRLFLLIQVAHQLGQHLEHCIQSIRNVFLINITIYIATIIWHPKKSMVHWFPFLVHPKVFQLKQKSQ